MSALKSDYRRTLEAGARALEAELAHKSAQDGMAHLLEAFPGEVCLVSSFGAESAVLLHMLSELSAQTPVLFLDTERLFDETLTYQRELADRLGLENVQIIRPEPAHLEADDPDDELYRRNSDLCCHIRKTLPLIKALRPYKVWMSGRKRHHGGLRAALKRVEIQDGKLKLNPLYDWSAERLESYVTRHNLPRHPLVASGYRSIGCLPCTAPVGAHEDARAGRWAGQAKTECGIHFGPNGQINRRPN